VEANPLTGSLAFALPDADPNARGSGRRGQSRPGGKDGKGRPMQGRRGRPANIRHRSR
jgi:ribonuclease R